MNHYLPVQKTFNFFPREEEKKATDFIQLGSKLPPGVTFGASARFARILQSQLCVKTRETATA